jgi:sec-independent protein translocase protein TatA
MIGLFQPWHLMVTLVIVMMVFGPGKLPQLGRALGDGLRELKRAGAGDAPSGLSAHAEPSVEQFTVVASATVCPSCARAVVRDQRFCGACGAGV